MSSASKRRLAPRGSVRTKVSNGSLQLVFSHGGKRRYLSLRLPDSAVNRKVAEAKAKLIESDILFDRLDPSLNKYRPQSVLAAAAENDADAEAASKQPSLLELWNGFVAFKRPQCSPNSMQTMYLTFTNYVRQLPTHELSHAPAIRDYVLANIPLNSGKRLMTRLSACCQWAMKSGLITENPFIGMAAEIKLPKAKKIAGFSQINPFSLEERDAIIQAIATDRFRPATSAYTHSFYTSLVKFLFATGCRSSEASALQWRNISEDCRQITFDQAIIKTENGRRVRKGLKTQASRRFPCNDSLRELLLSIRPQLYCPQDWVFPSPTGKPIELNNFRRRTWKPVLLSLEIPYRKLYQTRHTFITHALETGQLDAKDVAQLVGNSPEVIYQHYAGQKRELIVPEF
ncbi:MAG: Arm DNA-binding domain-containing protein [Phormidesmis sp.]